MDEAMQERKTMIGINEVELSMDDAEWKLYIILFANDSVSCRI